MFFMQINIPFASRDGQAEKGLKNRGGIKTKSPQTGVCGDFFCDPTGTRTQGPFIKSEMLYRLSYWIYRFWKSVPETGLEPARPKTDTSPSSLRVYQFHHPGRVWCSLCFHLSVAKVRLFLKLQRFFSDFFPEKGFFLLASPNSSQCLKIKALKFHSLVFID